MSEPTPTETERLAALEAQLATLVDEKAAEQKSKAALEAAFEVPPGPEATGYKKELLEIQDAQHAIGQEAHEEYTRLYQEQVEKNKGRSDRLLERLAALKGQFADEDERHEKALAAIQRERDGVRAKLDDLSTPKVSFEDLLATPERQAKLAELSERARGVMTPVMFVGQR